MIEKTLILIFASQSWKFEISKISKKNWLSLYPISQFCVTTDLIFINEVWMENHTFVEACPMIRSLQCQSSQQKFESPTTPKSVVKNGLSRFAVVKNSYKSCFYQKIAAFKAFKQKISVFNGVWLEK